MFAVERIRVMFQPSTPKDMADILIVDSDPDNLQALERFLKKTGSRTWLAKNGGVALQTAELDLPKVLLLDIDIPDMGRCEVCRLFKENEELTKCSNSLFLTGLQKPGGHYVLKAS